MGRSQALKKASGDINEIAGQFGAANLRVFGSFAKGSATENSVWTFWWSSSQAATCST